MPITRLKGFSRIAKFCSSFVSQLKYYCPYFLTKLQSCGESFIKLASIYLFQVANSEASSVEETVGFGHLVKTLVAQLWGRSNNVSFYYKFLLNWLSFEAVWKWFKICSVKNLSTRQTINAYLCNHCWCILYDVYIHTYVHIYTWICKHSYAYFYDWLIIIAFGYVHMQLGS
jgi:hypothetical protein